MEPPLCRAVICGNVGRVKQLLEAGADVNVRNPESSNGTPLMAVFMSQGPIGELLFRHGADMTLVDDYGDNVVLKAMVLNQHKFLELLLAHGAPVDCVDSFGMTALMQAVKNNRPTCVAHLLAHGAFMTQPRSRLPVRELAKREDIRRMLEEEEARRAQPQPLRDLCRKLIRSRLSGKVSLAGKVIKLPLPPLIKEYLLYNAVSVAEKSKTSTTVGKPKFLSKIFSKKLPWKRSLEPDSDSDISGDDVSTKLRTPYNNKRQKRDNPSTSTSSPQSACVCNSRDSPMYKLVEALQRDLAEVKANSVSKAEFDKVKAELSQLKADSVSRAEFDGVKDKLKLAFG